MTDDPASNMQEVFQRMLNAVRGIEEPPADCVSATDAVPP